jgi:hypothetical protein
MPFLFSNWRALREVVNWLYTSLATSDLSLQTGPMLVTHWGLSGPVVLRLSAWGARELHQCNYQGMVQLKYTELSLDSQLGAMASLLYFSSFVVCDHHCIQ